MPCDTAVHIVVDSTRNCLAREKWTKDIRGLLSACEGGTADTRPVVVNPFNTRTQPFHPRKPCATDVCTAVCPVRHTMGTTQKCTSGFRPNHVKPKKSRHNADHLLAIHTVFVHSGGATTLKVRGANAVGSVVMHSLVSWRHGCAT